MARGTFYALRYLPEVSMDLRKHEPTVGRWEAYRLLLVEETSGTHGAC